MKSPLSDLKDSIQKEELTCFPNSLLCLSLRRPAAMKKVNAQSIVDHSAVLGWLQIRKLIGRAGPGISSALAFIIIVIV